MKCSFVGSLAVGLTVMCSAGAKGAAQSPSPAASVGPLEGVPPERDRARNPVHRAAVEAIARDIEQLKADYPQLAEFSAMRNIERRALGIGYGFRTHEAQRTGGWTSGVPAPDDDGVWFSIAFFDPESRLQVHTQPTVHARTCFRDLYVQVLMREGKETRSLLAPVWKILRKHGVRDCAER